MVRCRCYCKDLSKEEFAICEQSVALDSRSPRSLEACLEFDQYLLGPIEPKRMAKLIVHNNRYHGATTYQQIGHLYGIMEASAKNPLNGNVYNMRLMRKQIEEELDEIAACEREREQRVDEQIAQHEQQFHEEQGHNQATEQNQDCYKESTVKTQDLNQKPSVKKQLRYQKSSVQSPVLYQKRPVQKRIFRQESTAPKLVFNRKPSVQNQDLHQEPPVQTQHKEPSGQRLVFYRKTPAQNNDPHDEPTTQNQVVHKEPAVQKQFFFQKTSTSTQEQDLHQGHLVHTQNHVKTTDLLQDTDQEQAVVKTEETTEKPLSPQMVQEPEITTEPKAPVVLPNPGATRSSARLACRFKSTNDMTVEEAISIGLVGFDIDETPGSQEPINRNANLRQTVRLPQRRRYAPRGNQQ